MLEQIEHLDAPVLQRLLRRTVVLSLIVGGVAVFLALLVGAPLSAVGIVAGLSLAIVNLRFLDAGVAKLRLNPGNITDPVKTREVVRRALETKTPIRIGVNMGSLARDIEETLGHTPEGLVASALRHVDLLEELGHTDILISVKAHDPLTTIYAYRLLAKRLDEAGRPYPLHLGVTEVVLARPRA